MSSMWIVRILVECALCFNFPSVIAQNATYATDMELITSSEAPSRKRRYVAFPEGSSFSVAVCSTIGIIGNPKNNLFSYGLNWGIGYDLPNQTWVLNHLNGFSNNKLETKSVLKRRHRRDLYQKIEFAIDNIGHNGRECLLRTLCESSKIFSIKEDDMIMSIFKSIFSFPRSRILSYEHPDTWVYDKAFRQGQTIELNCESAYRECKFSLLGLLLNKIWEALENIT